MAEGFCRAGAQWSLFCERGHKAYLCEDPQEAEWRAFLLPAGYSEQLEARVSQMVDIDWGTSDHHLTDVTANKVASKVFAEMAVLCISADFVPSKKSKPDVVLAARTSRGTKPVLSRGRAVGMTRQSCVFSGEGNSTAGDEPRLGFGGLEEQGE